MKEKQESLKQLFQQEFAKMVAVLTKRFGLDHIEIAEDMVSETFLLAAETWGVKGIPPNPAAWLYAVAKQKTLYYFRRNKIFDENVLPELVQIKETEVDTFDLDFSKQNLKDSQLQMLFAICNPAIASEAQIGLALRVLCGFGIDEIADAFLSNKETINKRLYRAKEKLKTEQVKLEFPPENELQFRLDNVLHIIYLLFNEGYYSKTQNQILQKDLCVEAMRLGLMLTEFDKTNLPKTNALIALMCFHASRFEARVSDIDTLVLYEQQDETLWDTELITRGNIFLNLSAEGSELSSYHLEAKIAQWHCLKQDTAEKWEAILQLYDQLILINYSPSVALNRVLALYKTLGREAALNEMEQLNMENNHFYFVLLAELYKGFDLQKRMLYLNKAFSLAKTPVEKQFIQQQINTSMH